MQRMQELETTKYMTFPSFETYGTAVAGSRNSAAQSRASSGRPYSCTLRSRSPLAISSSKTAYGLHLECPCWRREGVDQRVPYEGTVCRKFGFSCKQGPVLRSLHTIRNGSLCARIRDHHKHQNTLMTRLRRAQGRTCFFDF